MLHFFKIYLSGDTYAQFDGEVLIVTTKKNPLLVNEYDLKYRGEFSTDVVLDAIKPFLSDETQGVAFIRAGSSKVSIYNEEAFDANPKDELLKTSKMDKLKLGTLRVYPSEISQLVYKSEKDGIKATSTVEELNWLPDNGGTICDIRNAITIFEGTESVLVFTMGGINLRKKLLAKDKEKLLKN